MKSTKLTAILLSATILLALTACNHSGEETEVLPSESSETEVTTTEETTTVASNTSEESIEPTFVIREDDLPAAYLDILNQVNYIINLDNPDDLDPTQYGDGFTGIIEETFALGSEKAHEDICFAITDVNEDGTDELILATRISDVDITAYISPVYRAGYSVLAVYTLSGDDANLVTECWSRSSVYINADRQFIRDGSGGAAYHETSINELEENSTSLTEIYRIYTEPDSYSEEINVYESFYGTPGTIIDSTSVNDNIWQRFDDKIDEYTANMFELELIPVCSLIA